MSHVHETLQSKESIRVVKTKGTKRKTFLFSPVVLQSRAQRHSTAIWFYKIFQSICQYKQYLIYLNMSVTLIYQVHQEYLHAFRRELYFTKDARLLYFHGLAVPISCPIRSNGVWTRHTSGWHYEHIIFLIWHPNICLNLFLREHPVSSLTCSDPYI